MDKHNTPSHSLAEQAKQQASVGKSGRFETSGGPLVKTLPL